MSNIIQKTYTDLENPDFNQTYVNSRYAPVGNQSVGLPFPMYKEYGGRLTDWRSSAYQTGTWKKQFDLPFNTNLLRTSITQDSINLGNDKNNSWVSNTQTLKNVTGTLGCNDNKDCDIHPNTTCNINYQNWNMNKGSQTGGYCSTTVYPELKNDTGQAVLAGQCGTQFVRLAAHQGGIGKKCTQDSECGKDYFCNNEVNVSGSNIQQTGYCAMKYECPQGKTAFLGTPWNSGIPIPPPSDQNAGGGYSSQAQCMENAQSTQNCVQMCNGKWVATYPGYCEIAGSLRGPQGETRTSSINVENQGFTIPAFATSRSSNWEPQRPRTLASQEPLDYFRRLDPIPPNLTR